MFIYRAKLLKVIDGDTVDLEIDLGFYVKMCDRFRLYGIDTPELNSTDPAKREAARTARDELKSILGQHKEFTVKTYKREKFGRWLCEIFLPDREVSVNAGLVNAGLAKEYRPAKPR